MDDFLEPIRLYRDIATQFTRIYAARAPMFLTFDITYRCNLRCVTCPIWQDAPTRKEKDNELTKEQICSVVDDACRNFPGLCFRFLGGEPLIRSEVPEIVSYIKSKNALTSIGTNGTLIDEGMARDLVDSGLDELRISVDAIGPALDKIRGGKDVWGRIHIGVENLKAARLRKRSNKPDITFSCTVSKLNVEYLQDIYIESRRLGVGFVCYPVEVMYGFNETSGHSKHPPQDYALDFKDRAAIRGERYTMSRSETIRGRTFHDAPRAITRWAFDYLKFNLRIGKNCNWVNPFILIDPYGDVIPCRKMDRCSFGNVKELPIHEILSGEKRKTFLANFQKTPSAACQDCNRGIQWWGYLQNVTHRVKLLRKLKCQSENGTLQGSD